jgi:hypothetical protein
MFFCPGGIQNINELNGINVGKRVIENLEDKIISQGHPKYYEKKHLDSLRWGLS